MKPFRLTAGPIRLIAGVLLAACIASCAKKNDSGAAPPTSPIAGPTATVTGVVIAGGASGLPLPGVVVSSNPSAAAGVTTNSFGYFSLKVPANTLISVDGAHAGYATHPMPLQLSTSETRAVLMVLTPIGAQQSVSTAAGGKVVDPVTRSSITVPAGFVTGTSNAIVSVSGIAPDQSQVLGMPGTFAARTTLGAESTVEPIALAEITVGDGAGTSFPLVAPAAIELHLTDALAADPRVISGQPIPVFRYDATSGEWKAFGSGLVGASSVDGKPAVQFSVNSLSWFAAGFLNGSNACASGVVQSGGQPVSGATVQAFPGSAVVTGASGAYQVKVPPGATARLVATRPITGSVALASATITGGKLGTGCVDQNLTLDATPPPSSYTVYAQLLHARDAFGVPRDYATARIFANDGHSTPISGAQLSLHNGFDNWTIAPTTPGLYALISGISGTFNLDAGTTYTLDVDLEPDGVLDASAALLMPGVPQIEMPVENDVVADSAVVNWLDPASAELGYAVRYVGSVENQSFGTFPVIFALDTPAGSTKIGTGVGQPQYNMPNDPLVTGNYTLRLWATNGSIRYPVGATIQFNTPNLNGSRVVGWYAATAKADSVHFNALSSGGPRPSASLRPGPRGEAGAPAAPASRTPSAISGALPYRWRR